MTRDRKNIIAGLTEELEPVRAFRRTDGVILVAAAAVVTIVGIVLFEGLWMGFTDGTAAPFFWITNGLLLLLGLASAGAAIAMASPRVGVSYEAPKWAAAMVGVLPVAAFITVVSKGVTGAAMNDPYALHCVSASLVAALVSGAALTVWLRRGAPVSLNLAGWLIGLAAGSIGTVAYGISCEVDTIAHMGIWHVAPVVMAAIIGRLAVPALVRW